MQTVGERLKRARLEKNLSLDEVYQQTKIHTRVLEALEEDRAHNFLNLLYVKGFLKTYAQYLGLNAEELLKEYSDSQSLREAPVEAPAEKKPKVPLRIKPLLMVRLISIVAVSFILIFYLRFVINRISKAPQEANLKKVKVEVLPVSTVLPKKLVLEVRATDKCWLGVKVDNQSMFQGTLSKGNRERWEARERIELRIGKPEALAVFVNDKRIDLKKIRVKKGLVITRDGVVGK
ncbi:MAG: DUF4115 domain-containing protein [Omnitrophica bacterium]|nr:DUF4115 domain-containing protein [Candidatus Omnitrophota bacterium]